MNQPPSTKSPRLCRLAIPLALLWLLFIGGCSASAKVDSVDSDIPSTPAGATPLGAQAVPTGSSGQHDAPAFGPAGTWYLADNSATETLQLSCSQGEVCGGTLTEVAGGTAWPVDLISYQSQSGALHFRVAVAGVWHWYHTRIVEGVLTGRYATSSDGSEPAATTSYGAHVTGWKSEYFDRSLTPRVYDLLLDSQLHARVRIDRAANHGAGFDARIKVYASELNGAADEGPEYDATVQSWDGEHLAFAVTNANWQRIFNGLVEGRTVSGTFSIGTTLLGDHNFTGTRAEVLGHGFTGQSIAERAGWQQRMKKQLTHLIMNDNGPPLTSTVTVLNPNVPGFVAANGLDNRDDGLFTNHVQSYHMQELEFDFTLADPNAPGGPPLTRSAHGFLALPNAPPPAGGYPAVVAINGHTGSAAQVMMPDNEYFWYGDAYAQRGYAVLSIDISHRPDEDRNGLYVGYDNGDDPANGNFTHPAVKSPGMDPDWEEDGERTWDVQRGLDWLLAQPNINTSQVVMSGLSMGGEIATYAAAFDTRFTMAIPAGFSPDLSVLLWRGSHGCWQWVYADIREYLDPSDLHALIAPRPLVVETGKMDFIYSEIASPFSGDKQELRRSRPEWPDAPDSILHYLHYDVHHFHFGISNPVQATEADVRIPVLIAPDAADPVDWQTDPTTSDTGADLFAVLTTFLTP